MPPFILRVLQLGAGLPVAALGGTALVSYGASQIYEPAGYITAGLIMLLEAWLQGREGHHDAVQTRDTSQSLP